MLNIKDIRSNTDFIIKSLEKRNVDNSKVGRAIVFDQHFFEKTLPSVRVCLIQKCDG